MGKPVRFKHKKKHYTLPEPGTTPGFVFIDSSSLKPKINFYSFSASVLKLENLNIMLYITDKKKNKELIHVGVFPYTMANI